MEISSTLKCCEQTRRLCHNVHVFNSKLRIMCFCTTNVLTIFFCQHIFTVIKFHHRLCRFDVYIYRIRSLSFRLVQCSLAFLFFMLQMSISHMVQFSNIIIYSEHRNICTLYMHMVSVDFIGIIAGTTKVLYRSKERAKCELECDGGRDKVIQSSFYRQLGVDISEGHSVRSSQVHVKYKFNPFGTHAH